jgi:hypothetical protein
MSAIVDRYELDLQIKTLTRRIAHSKSRDKIIAWDKERSLLISRWVSLASQEAKERISLATTI